MERIPWGAAMRRPQRVAQRWAPFALLCGSLGRRESWFRHTGPGEYNRVHVSPSTLGRIGSLVLYHLPAIAQAAHSFGFRIRHPGQGD